MSFSGTFSNIAMVGAAASIIASNAEQTIAAANADAAAQERAKALFDGTKSIGDTFTEAGEDPAAFAKPVALLPPEGGKMNSAEISATVAATSVSRGAKIALACMLGFIAVICVIAVANLPHGENAAHSYASNQAVAGLTPLTRS
jgi:hypothetical protein